jgi:hypothetical protein
MTLLRRAICCVALVLLSLGVSRSASAQASPRPGVYVSASVLADVKRFSGDPAEPVLDGEAFGANVTVGTRVHRRWDLQLGVDVPRFTETTRERTVTFQRSTIALQSTTRDQALSIATLVRFRAAQHRRIQIGYLAGMSIVRLRRDLSTAGPPRTPASLIPKPSSTVTYGAAPTLGMDARVAVTSRISIVPGVHAYVFNSQDAGGVFVRPRIALRWDF